jgi:hypothetical protein
MINWIRKFQIGMLHATYHRNMKRADAARSSLNVIKYKIYIYRAEDAWRKLVILQEKTKK